jgi:hypothetical protein
VPAKNAGLFLNPNPTTSMNESLDTLKAKLEETRQRVRNLTVLGLDGTLSAQKKERLRNLELATREEAKLRRKALDYEQERLAKGSK